MRSRPLCILAISILLLKLGPCTGNVRTDLPESGSGAFERMLTAAGKVRGTAGGVITRREDTAEGVRLYVSGVTFIDQDTVYENISKGFQVFLDRDYPGALPGNLISCRGIAALPQKASCPGQTSTSVYLEARHIGYIIQKAEIIRIQRRLTLRGILARIRLKLAKSFQIIFPGSESGIMCALALGESSMMERDQRELYAMAGVSHIFSVSGMHIALAGMSLYRLMRRKRHSFFTCAACGGILGAAFGVMTGPGVGTVRAMVMFLIWLGSQCTGRCYDLPSAAALAALLISFISPASLYDAGFWLSFGCIVSIQVLCPVFDRLLRGLPVKNMLSVSAAVFTGTLPLTCHFFFQFSPLSVFTNLIVIPLLPALMGFGFAGAVLTLFFPAAGMLFSLPCHFILRFLSLLCQTVVSCPGGVIITGSTPLAAMAACYVLLLAAVRICTDTRLSLWRARVFFLILFSGMVTVLFRPRPSFRVSFLDVGQGDCTLISGEDYNVMVDCGSSTDTDIWDHRIQKALKYYGISRLDAVFITHGDLDHYSGLASYMEKDPVMRGGLRIDTLITGENLDFDDDLKELAHNAARRGIGVLKIKSGWEKTFGTYRIRCLYPSRKQCLALEGDDKNIRSLVLEVNCGRTDILLTGDLEKDGEELFAASSDLDSERDQVRERIRILKCGHHGSPGGTGEALLDAFSPTAALISCGAGNRYGHPSGEVLERLQSHGVFWYRTDRDGTVTLTLSRGKVQMEAYTNRE